MKKSILVTGVAGSGKSSISKELNKLGYRAYDIEGLDGMFKMVRKDTKEDFEDYDNADLEKVKNADWICDKNKLNGLLQKQNDGIVFYCGVASNSDEIVSLFDQIILLKASPEMIRKRLSNREGTDDMGNTAENREWVLSWKDWWENQLIEKGAIVVDADGNPTEVAQKIIEIIKK
jgi:broad-specificity NMP kinase